MTEDTKPKPESGEMETQTTREQNSPTEKLSKIYVADSTPASIYPSTIAPRKYYTPERYDGQSPSGLSQFLFQCRSEFNINAAAYATERAKVQFAINFLLGAIAETVIAHMENETCRWKNDFEAFAEFLEDGWGDPNKRRTATAKLQTLRQGPNTAWQFFVEFDRYRAVLKDYPTAVLIGWAVGREGPKL
ncbi:hypothetical protein J008_05069 [Cryptococcus neoformans]|nr:hypothetical protein J008_05069 [Cryptococcus neoformans var. grubii]